MDDILGSYAIGADKNFLVHPCAKEVDRYKGRARGIAIGAKLLAKQHFEAIQRNVFRCGYCISDYLGVDHWELVIRWQGRLNDV